MLEFVLLMFGLIMFVWFIFEKSVELRTLWPPRKLDVVEDKVVIGEGINFFIFPNCGAFGLL